LLKLTRILLTISHTYPPLPIISGNLVRRWLIICCHKRERSRLSNYSAFQTEIFSSFMLQLNLFGFNSVRLYWHDMESEESIGDSHITNSLTDAFTYSAK